jgi:outer membrane protein TolC
MRVIMITLLYLTVASSQPAWVNEQTPDSAIAIALTTNPEIAVSSAMLEKAHEQLTGARLFILHSVALHFSAPIIQIIPTDETANSAYLGKPTDLTLVLSMDFGDLATLPSRIRKEKITIRQAESHLKRTEQQVVREIKMRFSQLKRYERELTHAVEATESAEILFSIMEKRFSTREIDYEVYHSSLAGLMKSRRGVEELSSHLEIALANLESLVGTGSIEE